MKNTIHSFIVSGLCSLLLTATAIAQVTYPIVDTAQKLVYSENGEINNPKPGDQYYGQDAQYVGAQAERGGQSRREGQNQSRGQNQTSSFMDRADRNGDGKVTKEEFRGPDNRFHHLDKNSDGSIVADEAPRGPSSSKRRP